MSTNNILFIFEGEKTERQISNNLTKYFLDGNTVITCAYCTTIYPIYKELTGDSDLDIFSLLKVMPQNEVILKMFNRNDFAEVYMFFDYDGHSSGADDLKLQKLLNFFNEETESGKLYISYPMVESLKHISNYSLFKDAKVDCKTNIYYKNFVSQNCLKGLINLTMYNLNIWKKLINCHLSKMNHVVKDDYRMPMELIPQSEVFENQLKKYITVDSTVAVLSSFPMFLHDYYGNERLRALIS